MAMTMAQDIDRNAARLLAEMFDKDYPTDQRGIGNLGRAYLEALQVMKSRLDFFEEYPPDTSVEDMIRSMEMAAYGEPEDFGTTQNARGPRSVWWWISPRALWKRWGE